MTTLDLAIVALVAHAALLQVRVYQIGRHLRRADDVNGGSAK